MWFSDLAGIRALPDSLPALEGEIEARLTFALWLNLLSSHWTMQPGPPNGMNGEYCLISWLQTSFKSLKNFATTLPLRLIAVAVELSAVFLGPKVNHQNTIPQRYFWYWSKYASKGSFFVALITPSGNDKQKVLAHV